MGIYLGQLPPAEIARLKAELAETLIANFCYPRFFDYRTDSLRMRPVDRAKRQEVWLYLSSVDFTAWSRLDLTSPDFQRQIERLFILFVQRNRSFFGEQGRKRMSDIRMLINSSSTSVVQGLRNHVTGQRQQGSPPFGSPRPVVSWSTNGTGERPDIGWEQIAAATMLLQQQVQEVRGETRPPAVSDGRATNGVARRTARGGTGTEYDALPQPSPLGKPERPVVSGPLPRPGVSGPLPGAAASAANGSTRPVPARPGISSISTSPVLPVAPNAVPPTPAMRKSEQAETQRKTEASESSVSVGPARTPFASVAPSAPPVPTAPLVPPTPLAPIQARGLAQPAPSLPVPTVQRDNSLMVVGEDDLAIFEQMRHQLLVWLRVEAVRLGLDISGQGPSQLLELLRQQSRFDETRLQVVSTLLNLANQIIKNGQVSVIDYKQALMFYLMHTRQ